MLSAFTARPLVELRQRDKSKIESVLLHGDRLFAGLSTGSLRIYRVNENLSSDVTKEASEDDTPRPGTANTKPADLLREQEKFSKHAVTQLALVKEANVLVSLSNYQVSFHDLADYELQDTLLKTKGATTFAVISHIVHDESTQIPEIVSYLAVAIKRKLLVWEWRDSAMQSEQREFSLPAAIRSITWVSGTKAILGMTSHYVLLDMETSKTTDIAGPGAIGGPSTQEASRFSGVGVSSLMGGLGPMPLATRLIQGEVLLAKDINTHFIDNDGKALKRRQVPWNQAPDAVGYSYPYLLALNTSKGTLEVRNPETLTALQSVGVPNAKMLYVPNPGVSLAHAGKGFVVAGERAVWRMGALGYDAQIDALIEAGLWDEALSLLGMLEDALLTDKSGRTDEVEMLKAEDLFKRGKHEASLQLFTDANAAPARVIQLFPSVISGEPSSAEDQASSGPDEDTFEELKSAQYKTKTTAKAETASIVGSIRESLRGIQAKDTSAATKDAFEGKELEHAVVELISFLVNTRTRIQRVLDFDGELKDAASFDELNDENRQLIYRLEDVSDTSNGDQDAGRILEQLRQTARLVDSTLFRCYMFARPTLAGPLFRLPNFIDTEVAQEKLLGSRRYGDLVDFLYGKGLHERALEILTSLGKGELDNTNVPDFLKGPQRIVLYLQNLSESQIDLILRFVDWPMHADPELAMEVFTGDGSNAEHLPRKKVLDYLLTVSAARAAQYLEYVIDEFDEKSAEIHHRLIEIYLQSTSESDGAKDEKKTQQRKLLDFVRSSRHYEPWRIVPLLRKDEPGLHEARAVVLGRMGQHKQALEIYVFDMNDIAKAEDYCNELWLDQHRPLTPPKSPSVSRPSSRHAANPKSPKETDVDNQTPYLQLLSLLLKPRSPRKAQLGPALDLLARHGARLPAASTLDLIPEHISVADVEAYFKARMRASTSTLSMARMAAGLRKTVDDNADAALRLGDEMPEGIEGAGRGRNRSVVISEDRICKVCRKRFGGSAIKVLPGGEEVVHYGCAAG